MSYYEVYNFKSVKITFIVRLHECIHSFNKKVFTEHLPYSFKTLLDVGHELITDDLLKHV